MVSCVVLFFVVMDSSAIRWQVGVPELVVFLNKVDLLGEGDAELQELVEMEVRRLGGVGFESPSECAALS